MPSEQQSASILSKECLISTLLLFSGYAVIKRYASPSSPKRPKDKLLWASSTIIHTLLIFNGGLDKFTASLVTTFHDSLLHRPRSPYSAFPLFPVKICNLVLYCLASHDMKTVCRKCLHSRHTMNFIFVRLQIDLLSMSQNSVLILEMDLYSTSKPLQRALDSPALPEGRWKCRKIS